MEPNDQTRVRHEHLEALRALVGNVYPNKFVRSDVTGAASHEDTITSIVESFKQYEPRVNEGEKPSAESLESANAELNKTRVRIAGRIAAPPRVMGKAAFVHLSDGVSRLQIYVRRQDVAGVHNDAGGGEVNGWEMFGLLDHGDFIGVEGFLFVTRTGELSVHVEKVQFLAKALLPSRHFEEACGLASTLLRGGVLSLRNDQRVVVSGHRDRESAPGDLESGRRLRLCGTRAHQGSAGEHTRRDLLLENAPGPIHVHAVHRDEAAVRVDAV